MLGVTTVDSLEITTSPVTVKTGPGALLGMVIVADGATATIASAWDNTAASGKRIAMARVPSTATGILPISRVGIAFGIGLTVSFTGGAPNIFVYYV